MSRLGIIARNGETPVPVATKTIGFSGCCTVNLPYGPVISISDPLGSSWSSVDPLPSFFTQNSTYSALGMHAIEYGFLTGFSPVGMMSDANCPGMNEKSVGTENRRSLTSGESCVDFNICEGNRCIEKDEK